MTTCACDVIEISRPAGESAGLRDDAGLQQT